MPTLPTVISKESVRVGGVNTEASPNAFGYQTGRALQGLGSSIASLARPIEQLSEKQNKLELSNAVAQTDIGKVAMDLQQNAPADGTGIADETFKQQKDLIDKNADEFFPHDNEAREKFKEIMYGRLPGWRDRAREFEYNQRDAFNRNSANTSVDTLINRVRVDPGQYDQSIQDAEAVIDAGNYPAGAKVVMKQNLRSNMAAARFESLMTNADSDDDFVRIQKELEDPRWQKEMTKEQFDKTASAVRTSRNSFITGLDAQARSVLDGMKERSKSREVIPDEEIKELAALVDKTRSPAITNSFVKVLSEQQILKQFKDKSPTQIDQAIKAQKSANPVVAGSVGQWASDASALTGGEISASYLISKLGIEYSADDIRAGKFNVSNKAGTSTAQGLFQFIDGTWISMMQKYGGQVGYDVSRMSRSQLLALRGDPALNTKMAAFYALENKRVLQKAGISVGDTELYLAHFLGAYGAIDFIRAMRADPTGRVRPYGDFTQGAINANMPVFYNTKAGRSGAPKSFMQVYNTLAAKMQPGRTQAQFENIQYLEGMRDTKQAAVNRDPIAQYQADGGMGAYQLSDASAFATRGADALGAAQFYNISTDDMKPFTEQEAAVLKKQLMDGDADQKLELMSLMANMDRSAPGMMRAGLKQLGETDTVLGYAASLMYDKNQASTASQIMRGQEILKDDKTSKEMFGTGSEANTAFYEEVGNSLSRIKPETRNAIFDAAKAHYAETYGVNGGAYWDADKFKQSVRAVVGGERAIGEVNSAPTIMPDGVKPEEFEAALDNMSDGDMASMSLDRVAPKDIYGALVSARDIADEGQFVWVGRNMYRVRMNDGVFLTTGEPDPDAPGRLKAFVFIADPRRLKQFAGEKTADMSPAAPADYDPKNALVTPEAATIIDNLGAQQ